MQDWKLVWGAALGGRLPGMGMRERALVYVSLVAGIVYLLGLAFVPLPGAFIVKALAIGPLVPVALLLLKDRNGQWLAAALAASTAGDVLLALPDIPNGFVYGLGAFLIAHVLYFNLFLTNFNVPRDRRAFTDAAPGARNRALGIVAMAVVLGGMLYPHLGELRVPVVVYILVISVMALAASLANFRTDLIAVGALLFMLSDAMIGITTFMSSSDALRLPIWASYYVAQFCIAFGFLYEKLVAEPAAHAAQREART